MLESSGFEKTPQWELDSQKAREIRGRFRVLAERGVLPPSQMTLEEFKALYEDIPSRKITYSGTAFRWGAAIAASLAAFVPILGAGAGTFPSSAPQEGDNYPASPFPGEYFSDGGNAFGASDSAPPDEPLPANLAGNPGNLSSSQNLSPHRVFGDSNGEVSAPQLASIQSLSGGTNPNSVSGAYASPDSSFQLGKVMAEPPLGSLPPDASILGVSHTSKGKYSSSAYTAEQLAGNRLSFYGAAAQTKLYLARALSAAWKSLSPPLFGGNVPGYDLIAPGNSSISPGNGSIDDVIGGNPGGSQTAQTPTPLSGYAQAAAQTDSGAQSISGTGGASPSGSLQQSSGADVVRQLLGGNTDQDGKSAPQNGASQNNAPQDNLPGGKNTASDVVQTLLGPSAGCSAAAEDKTAKRVVDDLLGIGGSKSDDRREVVAQLLGGAVSGQGGGADAGAAASQDAHTRKIVSELLGQPAAGKTPSSGADAVKDLLGGGQAVSGKPGYVTGKGGYFSRVWGKAKEFGSSVWGIVPKPLQGIKYTTQNIKGDYQSDKSNKGGWNTAKATGLIPFRILGGAAYTANSIAHQATIAGVNGLETTVNALVPLNGDFPKMDQKFFRGETVIGYVYSDTIGGKTFNDSSIYLTMGMLPGGTEYHPIGFWTKNHEGKTKFWANVGGAERFASVIAPIVVGALIIDGDGGASIIPRSVSGHGR